MNVNDMAIEDFEMFFDDVRLLLLKPGPIYVRVAIDYSVTVQDAVKKRDPQLKMPQREWLLQGHEDTQEGIEHVIRNLANNMTSSAQEYYDAHTSLHPESKTLTIFQMRQNAPLQFFTDANVEIPTNRA